MAAATGARVTGEPPPLRAHARRNRANLLIAAQEAFKRDGPDTSLEAIARAAGVGIGTLYRHFPTREALILATYDHEVDQLCDTATELLADLAPPAALREWLNRLARYAITKHGLADALSAASSTDKAALPVSYSRIVAALGAILDANTTAGTIRAGLSPDDVMLAMSGLFHLDGRNDWEAQANRLLELLLAGLHADTPTRQSAPGAATRDDKAAAEPRSTRRASAARTYRDRGTE